MKLKFHKFLEDAKLPTRAHEDDAGLDMYAAESKTITPKDCTVRLGVGVDIPRGYVGLLLPRSSMNKRGVATLLGVIDSGYTGEVKTAFFPAKPEETSVRIEPNPPIEPNPQAVVVEYCGIISQFCSFNIDIHKGERVCQLVVVPIMCVDACWDTEKEEERGSDGFGSTGR